tara:strand:+ start:372 stop:1178 length:807 start_codon:yes stop_codon:yes gene_type:complete
MNKEYKINNYVYKFLKRIKYIKKCFVLNSLFWIFYLFIIIYLSINFGFEDNNCLKLLSGLFTSILVMNIGYLIHVISHNTNYIELYNHLLKSNIFIFKILKYLPNCIHRINRYFILFTGDFHDKIHHDSSVNKKWYNITIEAIQNIIMEGGLVVILTNMLNFEIKIKNKSFKINKVICIFWAFLYVSIHLINYNILDPNHHHDHHINNKTNYGLDLLDIVFDTKYNIKDVENINHGTINIIIIFVLLLLVLKSKSNNSIIKYIQNILI